MFSTHPDPPLIVAHLKIGKIKRDWLKEIKRVQATCEIYKIYYFLKMELTNPEIRKSREKQIPFL